MGLKKEEIDSLVRSAYKKTEVTTEQLKDILKPNLKTQLENAKKEVKRIEKLIEEDNEPKVGDWGRFWDDGHNKKIISKLINIYDDPYDRYETEIGYAFEFFEKITNPELIKLLEDESK